MESLKNNSFVLPLLFVIFSCNTVRLEYENGSPFNGDNYIKAFTNNSFIKSYDSKGVLRAKGRIYSDCGFIGKCTYYHSNGKRERIEYYELDTASRSPYQCKKKVNTWQYFDQEGKKVKEINFDLDTIK